MSKNEKILVLGLGSDILSDEGIGVRLIRLLENTNLSLIADFMTLNIGSIEIIEIIKNYDKVFIIDSIKTRSKRIGEIHVFKLNDYQKTINLSNPHDISFIDTINLGVSLNQRFPIEILIFAIEIEKEFEISGNLSEKLELKITSLVDELGYLIQKKNIEKKIQL